MKGKLTNYKNVFFKKVTDARNPVYGAELLDSQYKQLLFRSDGRGIHRMIQDGGLPERIPLEKVMQIRRTSIEEYQEFNISPFGFGACNSIEKMRYFEDAHRTEAQNQSLYVMLGDAVCLSAFKLDKGLELSPRDAEGEQIILLRVPIEHFLASITPEYKEKLWNGSMVPNSLSELMPDLRLPNQVRLEDLCSERNILLWLLVNNSEEMFVKVSNDMYAKLEGKQLSFRLGHDEHLIGAVQSALTAEKEPSFRA